MICRYCHKEQGLDENGEPKGLAKDFDHNLCTCYNCWLKILEKRVFNRGTETDKKGK